MMNAVLLKGRLSVGKLRQVFEEIFRVNMDQEQGVINIIVSSKGGDGVAAVKFVEKVRGIDNLKKIHVKIYRASSTAAYIALALGDYFEMKRGSILAIHRGEIRLSPSQISPEGIVGKELTDSFRTYDKALIETMKKVGLGHELIMTELHASDWFRITAEGCYSRKLVQSLF
jgi:hypothetical protein